jgi:hypothetical protein
MEKAELEKKIKSFSEHNGLGKTYHHYELIDTSGANYVPKGPGDRLPGGIVIKIRPDRKTELLFITIMITITLAVMGPGGNLGARSNALSYSVILISFLFTLKGLDLIAKGNRKKSSRLELNETTVSFNKDEFRLEAVETMIIKKDLDHGDRLKTLWLMIALKNGDLYAYEIPKRYAWMKVRGKYKLEELLYHYRENRKVESLVNRGSQY